MAGEMVGWEFEAVCYFIKENMRLLFPEKAVRGTRIRNHVRVLHADNGSSTKPVSQTGSD